jgi:hypothetical protein
VGWQEKGGEVADSAHYYCCREGCLNQPPCFNRTSFGVLIPLLFKGFFGGTWSHLLVPLVFEVMWAKIGCRFTKLGIISSEVLWVQIHETGYHQFRRFAASEKAKDMSRHQSRRVQVKGKSKTGDEWNSSEDQL